ncbi:MAG: hypothetical protein PHY63_01480 [Candidatus Cloacimonetes bacterium]|jgi:hypothetical protein|nr:hypothetical protein [Candidatus Cloacimonadota bacterium]
MKKYMYQITRILAFIAMLVGVSMLSIGNPKNIPYFILLFAAIFALVYYLTKRSQENLRLGKAGTGIKPITQLLTVVLFVALISIFGLLTHGILGFIGWFVVLGAIFFLIFLSVRRHQRHYEITISTAKNTKIIGIIFFLIAILLPLIVISFTNIIPITKTSIALTIVLSLISILAYIVLICLGLYLINIIGNKTSNQTLGYLAITLAALLPGIILLFTDANTMACAGIYIIAIITALLAYFAFNQLITNR